MKKSELRQLIREELTGYNSLKSRGFIAGENAVKEALNKIEDDIFTNEKPFMEFVGGLKSGVMAEIGQYAADLFAKEAGAAPDELGEASNKYSNFDPDEGMSDLDKRFKNQNTGLTIFDREETKPDNSGPWATTATSETLYSVMSRNGERYSINEIKDWAKNIFKSSYMVSREVLEVYETVPGEWEVEVKTTVWQN